MVSFTDLINVAHNPEVVSDLDRGSGAMGERCGALQRLARRRAEFPRLHYEELPELRKVLIVDLQRWVSGAGRGEA